MCLKQKDQFATHILKDYLCKLHIDSSIDIEHKHISTKIDKGVHPLMGYISWSSFQWIIIINFSKSAQKHVLQCSN